MKTRIFFLFLTIMVIGSCQDKKPQRALIETELGNITIELFDATPLHRDNFIKLVNEKYYDGTLFHRAIKDFMIQGGDPDSKTASPDQILGMGGPPYTIPAEIAAPHFKGALAAGNDGNPQKASSGSQFYIVTGTPQNGITLTSFERQKGIKYNKVQFDKYLEVGGAPQLDQDYTVFGRVISGMEVVDKISALQTAEYDRPVKDLKMTIKLIK